MNEPFLTGMRSCSCTNHCPQCGACCAVGCQCSGSAMPINVSDVTPLPTFYSRNTLRAIYGFPPIPEGPHELTLAAAERVRFIVEAGPGLPALRFGHETPWFDDSAG